MKIRDQTKTAMDLLRNHLINNIYMAQCRPPQASDFYGYPSIKKATEVWLADDEDPCFGSLLPITLYQDASDGKYYYDFQLTDLFSGTIFETSNKDTNFIRYVDGVPQDSTENVCPTIPSVIRWSEMGPPSDISKYGNLILAAYPEYHVIIKYDISTGTDPIGTIVAGEWYRERRNIYDNNQWLNQPTHVEWRDDGLAFVVFSGGGYKFFTYYNYHVPSGLSIFITVAGGESFDYQGQIDQGYTTKPPENGLLMDLLTPRLSNDESANDRFFLVRKLQYNKGVYDNADVVTVGIYNKQNDGYNGFAIYAFVRDPDSLLGEYIQEQWVLYYTDLIRDGDSDIVRDFAVTKKTSGNSAIGETFFQIAVVTPRSTAHGGSDRFRYYGLHEVSYRLYKGTAGTGATNAYRLGNIGTTPSTSRLVGHYRINSVNNNQYSSHVKADINYVNGYLYVTVMAAKVGNWKSIKDFLKEAFTSVGSIAGTTVLAGALIWFLWGMGSGQLCGCGKWRTKSWVSKLPYIRQGWAPVVYGILGAAVINLLVKGIGYLASALFDNNSGGQAVGTGISRLQCTFGSTTTYLHSNGAINCLWFDPIIPLTLNTFMDSNRGGDANMYGVLSSFMIRQNVYSSPTAGSLTLVAPTGV